MSKKIPFLLACCALTFLISCKKQYSCQCSITIEKPGYYPYTTSTVEKIDKKSTKKKAEQTCAYSEKQLHKYANENTSPDETLTTSCAIK